VGAIQTRVGQSRLRLRDRFPGSLTVGLFVLLWVGLVVVPLALTIAYSVLQKTFFGVQLHVTSQGYSELFAYGRDQTIIRTFKIAAAVTSIEFVVAFPTAYWLAKRVRSRFVSVSILVLLTVPFFLSEDSRTVIWRSVYDRHGLVNTLLEKAGLVHAPISSLLFSELSVYLGLVPIYFATMMFPIWLSMTFINDEYLEAARDLGASTPEMLVDIVLPLAAPGVITGIIFTFVPMLGDSVVPTLLGGGNVQVIGNLIQDLVTVFQYPVAAALSITICAIAAALLAFLIRAGSLRKGLV
jgi:spermidine/putrescine transport system permease protein